MSQAQTAWLRRQSEADDTSCVMAADPPPAIADQSSLWSFLPPVIGLVLVLAAASKSHALLTDPVAENRSFQIGLIEVECVCGLALVLGFCPVITRWAALALFSVLFLGASSYVLSGARSCACFGKVQLTPWAALVFDAGAILALWRWTPSRLPLRYLPGLICWLPLGLIPVFQLTSSITPFPQVILRPALLDIGEVVQARRVVVPLTVENAHDKPVRIESLESTCPCLLAPALPWIIGPRTNVSQEVLVTLDEEPAFSGLLIIEVKGRTSDGNLAFSGRLRMSVVQARSQVSMK